MTTLKRQDLPIKNEEFWKAFYTVACFLGILSIIFEIYIYRVTIIKVIVPISIILSVGLIGFLLNKKHYKRTYSLNGNFFPLMQNLVSCGFIACYIFMATNYYFADKDQTEYKFKIKAKSSMSGSKGHRSEREPLVTIDYFNFEKELVFVYADTKKVNQADSVDLLVRKGKLGYDILDKYDVVPNYR